MKTNTRDRFILIHSISLYRAESRYKKAYCYAKVAQNHADKINDKQTAYYREQCKRYGKKDAKKYVTPVDTVIVVSESEGTSLNSGRESAPFSQ